MKQFIYKTIIAIIAIVLVYELTIAKQIKEQEERDRKAWKWERFLEGIGRLGCTLRFFIDEDGHIVIYL